jgi:predicted transcriptional regulator
MIDMSPAIKALLEQVASWPQADQEELADYAREIEARRARLYRLSDSEREGVERGLKAMREGRFASDERMAAIFEKVRSARP